jgi:hypothetical protein
MGHRPSDRLKGADHGFHQVDLALERYPFRCAHRLLSIQLGSQGTASPQQHTQALDQAMTSPCIFLPLRFSIVESSPIKYPVTTGGLGRPGRLDCAWRCRCCSASISGCIVSRKCFSQCSTRAAACQGACARNWLNPAKLGPAATWRSSPRSVRLPSQSISPSSTVTKYWHWTPLWLQGWIFFSLIPHGVLSCSFPFQKCKHRVNSHVDCFMKIRAIQSVSQVILCC